MKKLSLLLTFACAALTTVHASDYPYAADPADLQIIYASDRNPETGQLPSPAELRELNRIFTNAKQLITALHCVTLDARGTYFVSRAFEALQDQSDDLTRTGVRYIQAINVLRSLLHNEDSVEKLIFLTEMNEALTDADRKEVATIHTALMNPTAKRSPQQNEQIKRLIDLALPMLPPAGAAQPAAAAIQVAPTHPMPTAHGAKSRRRNADALVMEGLGVAIEGQRKSPRKTNRSVRFADQAEVATYTRPEEEDFAMHGSRNTVPRILYTTDAALHGGFSQQSRVGTPTTSPLKGDK